MKKLHWTEPKLLQWRDKDRYEEYKQSEVVLLLLKHKMNISNRLDYFFSMRRTNSTSSSAVIFWDTKVLEALLKYSDKKHFPQEKLDELYKLALFFWRSQIIKIIRKYSKDLDITYRLKEKELTKLLEQLKHLWCSYQQIKFFLKHGIDIRKNTDFIKASFAYHSPLSASIILWENKIAKIMLQHKKIFCIYDHRLLNALKLARIYKMKEILLILEKYREKIDKMPLYRQCDKLMISEQFDELLWLIEPILTFDKPRTWWKNLCWFWYQKARCLHIMGDNKKSSEVLYKRLEYNQNDTDALRLLCTTLQNTWNYLQALFYVNKLIKITPRGWNVYWIYIRKAHILFFMKKYTLAKKYYQKEAKNELNRESALNWIRMCNLWKTFGT